MIGIDLTKISRFRDTDENFIERTLSFEELSLYRNLIDTSKEKFLATRWAIKEAIFKADNRYSSFNTMTIRKEGKRYLFEDFKISTSHEGDYLIAFVIMI